MINIIYYKLNQLLRIINYQIIIVISGCQKKQKDLISKTIYQSPCSKMLTILKTSISRPMPMYKLISQIEKMMTLWWLYLSRMIWMAAIITRNLNWPIWDIKRDLWAKIFLDLLPIKVRCIKRLRRKRSMINRIS